MRERASWFVFSNTRRNNCRLPVAASPRATQAAMLAIHPTKRHASPLKNKTPTMAMPDRGPFLYVEN